MYIAGYRGKPCSHTEEVQQLNQSAITRRELLLGSAALLLTVPGTRLFGAGPALPVAGLDHINLRVPDVRRSAEFYASLFGSELSRFERAPANPSSIPGQLWIMRLGQTGLSISPTAPGQTAGLDHFGLAIPGFDGPAMKSSLNGLNPKWDTPGNLWTIDPAGHIIQMLPPQDQSKPPGAGLGAVSIGSKPAFRVTRITKLVLAVPSLEESRAYYLKLLGDEAATSRKGTFRVGQEDLVLGPTSGGDGFRLGVAGTDLASVQKKLKESGAAKVTRSKDAVSFRDPDGMEVEIGL
jgi:catechol 2,3-dioxygenase-like lactoylglutathione lyase family enzyme